MERVKYTFIKGMIVLISLCCIDGGRSLLFTVNNAQMLTYKGLISDIELPNQQNHSAFSEDEKWVETFYFESLKQVLDCFM